MDSTTSHHHDESDDEQTELDRLNALDVLDDLAGAIGDERAAGSVLLTATPRPPRAFLGNPPRSSRKKRDQARSDPERDENR